MFYLINSAKPEAQPFGPWATRATAKRYMAMMQERMVKCGDDPSNAQIIWK